MKLPSQPFFEGIPPHFHKFLAIAPQRIRDVFPVEWVICPSWIYLPFVRYICDVLSQFRFGDSALIGNDAERHEGRISMRNLRL